MATPLKVLFVEDSEADAELTTAELMRGGFAPETAQVQTRGDMQSALNDSAWDLVICDYRMPNFSADAALSTLQDSGQDLPFIITSGAVTAEDVVNLLKQGAHDFMDKSALARLVPAVERELREAKMRQRRRRAEDRVRTLSRAIEQSPVSVVISDAEGIIEYVNPRFEQTTGYSAEEALGQSMGFTLRDEHNSGVLEALWAALKRGESWSGESCSMRRDGQLFWEYINASPLTDSNQKLTHYVVVKEDTTVRRNYEEQLRRQAHYDELTGLANRVLLLEKLRHTLQPSEHTQHPIAVLGIDLDHFKNVNDSVGHSMGDYLLKEAARRLGGCIRENDTLARMGGDEFTVILSELSGAEQLTAIAERIMGQFRRPFNFIGRDYLVTCSMGVALYPDDGDNPHLLIRNADLAMYQAKKNGRNQYQFFTEDINRRLVERLELESSLRHVVQRQELVLHYQPVYNLADGSVAGFESLVRWPQPDDSLRMPNDFIPVAEEMGIIATIDSWVLASSCREMAHYLRDQKQPLRLAVNISAKQLEVPRYASFVAEQLKRNKLSPEQLELEMTERVLVSESEIIQQNLTALHNLGVRMSIDDFGTGYSSLGYLQKYKFNTLKIDRSFVKKITRDKNGGKLVETIISLAHGLDMDVIAEGIELESEWDFLRRSGCDQAQGFFLSRPIPLGHIEEYLADLVLGS